MVQIITSNAWAVEALACASAKSLDLSTLHARYTSAINLAYTLNTCKNLTDEYHTTVFQIQAQTIDHDAGVANHNALSTKLTHLTTQLEQALALSSAASANTSNAGAGQFPSCKGRSESKNVSAKDRNKLRSVIALCWLQLINQYCKFPDPQSKLGHACPCLQGTALVYIIHWVHNEHIYLPNVEAFMTSIEEDCHSMVLSLLIALLDLGKGLPALSWQWAFP
jgi:hypothetical protein